MKYTDISLKVLAAKECGIVKSNALFWSNYADRDSFNKEVLSNDRVLRKAEELRISLYSYNDEDGIICAYDEDFPFISRKVKNNGDKPFLLFYKGDISLLKDLNKNVAVIGSTDPDEQIRHREADIVRRLIKNNIRVVSGLAHGCDTIAHQVTLESNGKTIAILPTQIQKIYPADNSKLAEEIVNKGGLLISEYYKKAITKQEAINRFIERDRLQAMFSKAIILIASYRKGEGDSGSRHAMNAAEKYGIQRYVMFDSSIDSGSKQFGLNIDMINNEKSNVTILTEKSIDIIKSLVNPFLYPNTESKDFEQLTLL